MADDLTIPKLREPEYPEVHPRKYLTPKLKAELALKQNGLCAICGCKPRAFEWDHILELWAGGDSSISNWQGLCRKCHRDKSGAEAKHRAKMNRCRARTGQLKRRRARGGSSIVRRPTVTTVHGREVPNLSGRRFGRLIARELDNSVTQRVHWLCDCDCGKETSVRAARLTGGRTQSCGCFVGVNQAKAAYRHGQWVGGKRTSEFMAWESMVQRCTNKNSTNYAHYGARGIAVCDRWREFPNFLADMGPRPTEKHSIDRIDVNGNYEPGNCRWADDFVQNRNKTDNRVLTHDGVSMCVAEWGEKGPIPASVIYRRLQKGWSVHRALTQPLRSDAAARNTFQKPLLPTSDSRKPDGAASFAVSALSKHSRGYRKRPWPKRGFSKGSIQSKAEQS